MLAAHLAPGYFIAQRSRQTWPAEWTARQRLGLWAVAFGSTVVPDLDVVYNLLVRGFFNHTTLWTHSLVPHLVILGIWAILKVVGYWTYCRTLLGIAAAGGLSHLFLDVICHGTPLFYPFSMLTVGGGPARVIEGGVLAYLTDPIFLFEPFALSVMIIHWLLQRPMPERFKRRAIIAVALGLILFVAGFIIWLPDLQSQVARHP